MKIFELFFVWVVLIRYMGYRTRVTLKEKCDTYYERSAERCGRESGVGIFKALSLECKERQSL